MLSVMAGWCDGRQLCGNGAQTVEREAWEPSQHGQAAVGWRVPSFDAAQKYIFAISYHGDE